MAQAGPLCQSLAEETRSVEDWGQDRGGSREPSRRWVRRAASRARAVVCRDGQHGRSLPPQPHSGRATASDRRAHRGGAGGTDAARGPRVEAARDGDGRRPKLGGTGQQADPSTATLDPPCSGVPHPPGQGIPVCRRPASPAHPRALPPEQPCPAGSPPKEAMGPLHLKVASPPEHEIREEARWGQSRGMRSPRGKDQSRWAELQGELRGGRPAQGGGHDEGRGQGGGVGHDVGGRVGKKLG